MLRRCRGIASRDLLRRFGLTRHQLDNEVRSGALATPFPRVHCRPWDQDDVALRERGAVMSVGLPAAVSHLSALRRWELLPDYTDPVHLSVPDTRFPRSHPGLLVHRVTQFPAVVRLDGLITVDAGHAIVTSWPLVPPRDRRAPAIDAVRRGLVTPAELGVATTGLPRLAGRQNLLELIDLLAAGCESELEIWGHRHVFNAPGLGHAVYQRRVRVRGELFRLDAAFEEERVAVELDGYRFHSSPAQRERDMRRDALLASVGWVVIRFSHRRLHDDPDGCRRDLLAALASRRHRTPRR